MNLFLCALTLLPALTTAESLDRHVYPLAPPKPAPVIEYDVSKVPEAEPWAQAAQALATTWFPILCTLLATEDWTPPETVLLVFEPKQDAPAWASGNKISIGGEWIAAHPSDLGMVIHELAHVVQSYPGNPADTGWMVEGIADYVRWWRYEPEAPRPRIDPEKSSYKQGYGIAASFLAWASRTYDMRLIPALDRELRQGKNPYPVFESMTGKDVDALWAEFVGFAKS